jgi:extracellular elastinolytic metalloproteinase
MVRELDVRDHRGDRATPERVAQLRSRVPAVSEGLTETHRVVIEEVDPRTGNASAIRSVGGTPVEDDLVGAALRHVQDVSPALGFDTTVPVGFQPNSEALRTSAGAAAVHLQETVEGIPVFQAALTVRFGPSRAVEAVVGSTLNPTETTDTTPSVSAVDAVAVAGQYLAEPDGDGGTETDQFGEPLPQQTINLAGFQPRVRSSEDNAERTTLLDAPPFAGPVRASLIWFDNDTALRLGWEIAIGLPNGVDWYRAIVDAHTGELLYCVPLTAQVMARGDIAEPDGGQARQFRPFPLPLNLYPVPFRIGLPNPFPRTDWVDVDQTEGNDVRAHLAGGGTAQGTVTSGVMTFDPADATGNDQLRVSLFYLCNYMHDLLYLLLFRESDGNFEQTNYGLGGAGSDRVDAIVHPGAVSGTANMFTPADGSAPTMNMGLVTSTSRHTALDSNVVFHEYTHGLTNRLVGGPADAHALDAIQSRSMGKAGATTSRARSTEQPWSAHGSSTTSPVSGASRTTPTSPTTTGCSVPAATSRYTTMVRSGALPSWSSTGGSATRWRSCSSLTRSS